jgi:hypothetical protein
VAFIRIGRQIHITTKCISLITVVIHTTTKAIKECIKVKVMEAHNMAINQVDMIDFLAVGITEATTTRLGE